MKTREQQISDFTSRNIVDPRDETATVFLNGVKQDESAKAFAMGLQLDAIQDPMVRKQVEAMAFGKPPVHKSAEVFLGSSPDPRDETARDFIGREGE